MATTTNTEIPSSPNNTSNGEIMNGGDNTNNAVLPPLKKTSPSRVAKLAASVSRFSPARLLKITTKDQGSLPSTPTASLEDPPTVVVQQEKIEELPSAILPPVQETQEDKPVVVEEQQAPQPVVIAEAVAAPMIAQPAPQTKSWYQMWFCCDSE
jgi:hypothetical protein